MLKAGSGVIPVPQDSPGTLLQIRALAALAKNPSCIWEDRTIDEQWWAQIVYAAGCCCEGCGVGVQWSAMCSKWNGAHIDH